MYAEDEHVAHPRLYGAPAYARPLSVTPTERPLDPDDLPIAAEQTEEERAIAEMLLSQPPAGQQTQDMSPPIPWFAGDPPCSVRLPAESLDAPPSRP